jgi:hypothetical protein
MAQCPATYTPTPMEPIRIKMGYRNAHGKNNIRPRKRNLGPKCGLQTKHFRTIYRSYGK